MKPSPISSNVDGQLLVQVRHELRSPSMYQLKSKPLKFEA
jgi:hypothetical protein